MGESGHRRLQRRTKRHSTALRSPSPGAQAVSPLRQGLRSSRGSPVFTSGFSTRRPRFRVDT